MIGSLDGSLDFAGQYFLVARAASSRSSASPSLYRLRAKAIQALMTAHARALDRLADHIAALITGAPAA